MFAAAQAGALALATGDSEALLTLLHPDFRWISEAGEQFDRARFVTPHGTGHIRWRRRLLMDPDVVIVGDTAILLCTVEHEIRTPEGDERSKHRMTQTWILTWAGWRWVAGHGRAPPQGLTPAPVTPAQRALRGVSRGQVALTGRRRGSPSNLMGRLSAHALAPYFAVGSRTGPEVAGKKRCPSLVVPSPVAPGGNCRAQVRAADAAIVGHRGLPLAPPHRNP